MSKTRKRRIVDEDKPRRASVNEKKRRLKKKLYSKKEELNEGYEYRRYIEMVD